METSYEGRCPVGYCVQEGKSEDSDESEDETGVSGSHWSAVPSGQRSRKVKKEATRDEWPLLLCHLDCGVNPPVLRYVRSRSGSPSDAQEDKMVEKH